jgi:hypothetical protein
MLELFLFSALPTKLTQTLEEIFMPDIYKTNDGREFSSESEARSHAAYIDAEAAKRSAKLEAQREGRSDDYNKVVRLFNAGNYDQAIEACNNHFIIRQYNEGKNIMRPHEYHDFLPGLLYLRGCCYQNKGDREQAIADYKRSADWETEYSMSSGEKGLALKNLASLGIQYTPNDLPVLEDKIQYWVREASLPHMEKYLEKVESCVSEWERKTGRNMTIEEQTRIAGKPFIRGTGSSSSSYSRSSSTASGGSILFNIIGAIVVAIIGFNILGWLGLIGGAVAGFFLGKWLSGKLIGKILLIALLVLVGGTFIINKLPSKPKTETAVTATATVNANVNFRTEPSTGDNIIRQLQQGDTVTLTGEVSGSWTQILHNGDKGWISSEFLNK